MQLIAAFLENHPEAAIFLSMAVGVVIGRVKIGAFSFGNATAVLIVATILGATVSGPLGLTYPPLLKTIACGRPLPIAPRLALMVGDILELVGRPADVERVTKLVGAKYPYIERADLAWLGLGLFGGTLLGALSYKSGGLVLTLGGGGGILIGGLVAGWYNSRHPLIGGIPHEAVRLAWDLGLALFVAVLGLSAGPSAVAALVGAAHESGPAVRCARPDR